MKGIAYMLVSLMLGIFLSGCGDTCEDIQKEIESIGREIQKNPESAMERSGELEELKNRLQSNECLKNKGY